MRVIRPAPPPSRARSIAVAIAMLIVGLLAAALVALAPGENANRGAVMAVAAAVGLGVGAHWLRRALRGDPLRAAGAEIESLLAGAFDDTYTLIVGPRLPGVRAGLVALLIGPAGVRALTVRHWRGRYRVRGRGWEYDTRGARGWIACRTNPSFEAIAIREGLARWAAEAGHANLPVETAIVFPRGYSELVLEEPDSEIVTADNVPWWANRIGRVQRLDAAHAAHFVEAVLDAADPEAGPERSRARQPAS